MTETVLVTGGAGYIGSHTCKALARAGFTPVSFDNLSRGHGRAVKWGPLEEGDIRDPERVREVIRRYRPAAVVHFAALAYAGESVLDPAAYFSNNVAGSLALLEAMRAEELRRIVFSSSCAVYGDGHGAPIPETAPFRPVSPYGASKVAVEHMLAAYRTAYAFETVSLRYFNAAGADPEGEIGENHEPETHLVPVALEAAAGRRPKLQVFGDAYATPDGTCIRDYVHVSDLADAHVLALRSLARHGGAAFNLGAGKGCSVREVIEVVQRVTGLPVPVEIGEPRAGDPPYAVGDASLARSVLGWRPCHDFVAIVQSAWKWMQQHRAVRG